MFFPLGIIVLTKTCSTDLHRVDNKWTKTCSTDLHRVDNKWKPLTSSCAQYTGLEVSSFGTTLAICLSYTAISMAPFSLSSGAYREEHV